MQHNQKVLYTCPMHPEVVQEGPGRCPKCGMQLVMQGSGAVPHAEHSEAKWKQYLPLIIIIVLIAAASAVAQWGSFDIRQFVINFMTGFFLVFSGFKLMDLKGFAEGYSPYDLLARRWFEYGYAYPFFELAFGLLMLAGYHPDWLLWTECGVMAFSGLGVALKLAKRERFTCACLGTFLKVPLTYITLIEDFGMALLALLLIFWK